MIMPQPRLQFLFCLLAYTLLVRLLPYAILTDPTVLYYPWNFSPLTAACLFGGAFLANRRNSFLIPMLVLFLSDVGIAVISGHPEWGFPINANWQFEWILLARWSLTYVCYAGAVGLGHLLRVLKPKRMMLSAMGLGIAFEVAYFLISNFLVWYGLSGSETPLYPMTAEGLKDCYVAALPFAIKSFLGTAAFSLLLFSPAGLRAATEPPVEGVSGELAPVRVK
jgi:hypothetical protein